MPDEIDLAQDRERIATDDAIRQVQRRADLPAGAPGECDLCGEQSARLVNGACAPCRDKYKLP
jgi:hypothetical protein